MTADQSPADKLSALLSASSLASDAAPLAEAIRWTSASVSHTGYVRQVNEDAFLDHREQGLWAVADGMGGHWGGSLASQTVIDNLVDFVRADDLAENVASLEQRLHHAHRQCTERAGPKRSMGSTAAMVFAHDPFCFFLWVGDSRVYRIRDGEIDRISRDHSVVEQLVRDGKITEMEARHHPSGNVITRAVGVSTTLDVEVEFATTRPGDTFLICSDGLYRHVDDDEMARALADGDLDHALSGLLRLALTRGGTDNITMVATRAEYYH
ncbi:MAG: protein phosphatase 2C domain-containing protein [Pseudomonadota bacterium]